MELNYMGMTIQPKMDRLLQSLLYGAVMQFSVKI